MDEQVEVVEELALEVGVEASEASRLKPPDHASKHLGHLDAPDVGAGRKKL